jgi:hypothetical protein
VSRLSAHGFDCVFLLFGERTSDFVSDRFDWKLLGEVVAVIDEWCDSRSVSIAGNKRGEVTRLIYEEYRRSATRPFDVGRILSLVA